MKRLSELSVKIFADGADLTQIAELAKNPLIKGFTTNPTLMRQAGVSDFEDFAKSAIELVRGLPISFEVFADDFDEMERQAFRIASWGKNVYVKIPVTNTRRQSSTPLVERLSKSGVSVNVTAVMTLDQVRNVCAALDGGTPAIVSVFAGRIADSGTDPVPLMRDAAAAVNAVGKAELLWASPREVLNIFHAEEAGCDIITVTNDLLRKFDLVGKNLDQFSLETVKMFHGDAKAARYKIA